MNLIFSGLFSRTETLFEAFAPQFLSFDQYTFFLSQLHDIKKNLPKPNLTLPVWDFSSSIILSACSWSGLVNWQSKSAVSTVITDILSARFRRWTSEWLSSLSRLSLELNWPSTSSTSSTTISGVGSSAVPRWQKHSFYFEKRFYDTK